LREPPDTVEAGHKLVVHGNMDAFPHNEEHSRSDNDSVIARIAKYHAVSRTRMDASFMHHLRASGIQSRALYEST
jgi:hypothetical protein